MGMEEQEKEVASLNPIACPKGAFGGNSAVVKTGNKSSVDVALGTTPSLFSEEDDKEVDDDSKKEYKGKKSNTVRIFIPHHLSFVYSDPKMEEFCCLVVILPSSLAKDR
jgi:hypothetical protein